MNGVPSRWPAFAPTSGWAQPRWWKRLTGHSLCLIAWCAALFCGSVGVAAPAALPGGGGGLVQSFTSGNVKATFLIPGDNVPRFGFVPVRLTIENREARDLRWQVRFTQTSFSNSGVNLASQSAFTVTAPASRTSERWLFVATADSGAARGTGYGTWGNLAVNVDGTAISDTNLFFNVGGRPGSAMVPWAVSASLESTVRAHLNALKTDTPVAGYRGRATPAKGPRPILPNGPSLFSFDPTQPYGDWRIWAPFSRVVLRADEYATLPPANRAALHGWIALGGMLYLAPEAAVAGKLEGIGAGQIVRLRAPIAADERHDSEGLFAPGTIFSPSLALPRDLGLPKEGLTSKISPAKLVGDWLVYFFVGFAVLVAPVNLFAIAPVKRRHWLFFTVPIISVGAVVALMTAIYLQDGVGGEGARRSLVVLIPGEHQAAVFQEQVSRTGLLFGTNFPMPEDAVCAAIGLDDGGGQPGRQLDFVRRESRASGDWFRGRTRQAQHLRRLLPTRARVELVGTAPDGAPIVQSSVGATLRDFCYVDSGAVAWSAASVPPGTRVTLARAKGGVDFARQSTAFGAMVSLQLQEVSRAALGAGLAPGGASIPAGELGWARGRFVALAGDSELAPIPSLPSIQWINSAVLMTGVVESAAPGKATP